jgi:hypothetical protein
VNHGQRRFLPSQALQIFVPPHCRHSSGTELVNMLA